MARILLEGLIPSDSEGGDRDEPDSLFEALCRNVAERLAEEDAAGEPDSDDPRHPEGHPPRRAAPDAHGFAGEDTEELSTGT